MKGQLDSQVAKHTNGMRGGGSSTTADDANHNDGNNEAANGNDDDDDDDPTSDEEHIEDWSDAKVRERSKELQLIDENGLCSAPPPSVKPDTAAAFRRFDHRHADEITLSEFTEDESKSASKSTTSDSQVSEICDPIENRWQTIFFNSARCVFSAFSDNSSIQSKCVLIVPNHHQHSRNQ